MRGVAYDPVFRAKLMAMHEEGVSLTSLSEEFGIARPVLSRWWQRYAVADVDGLAPHSRRPHTSPPWRSPLSTVAAGTAPQR